MTRVFLSYYAKEFLKHYIQVILGPCYTIPDYFDSGLIFTSMEKIGPLLKSDTAIHGAGAGARAMQTFQGV